MKKRLIGVVAIFGFLGMSLVSAQTAGYQVGDEAMAFTLPNVDGQKVSLSEGSNGAIVIFTCNTCPYAVAYQDRISELHRKYAPEGYPVLAINSNDAVTSPGDSYEEMKKRSSEKRFPFAYLYDQSQEVIKTYGGSRTPHVYLLNKEDGKFIVRYIGAIDNNYQDASAVTERYVEDAVEALKKGEEVTVQTTKAIGCTIKWTKKAE